MANWKPFCLAIAVKTSTGPVFSHTDLYNSFISLLTFPRVLNKCWWKHATTMRLRGRLRSGPASRGTRANIANIRTWVITKILTTIRYPSRWRSQARSWVASRISKMISSQNSRGCRSGCATNLKIRRTWSETPQTDDRPRTRSSKTSARHFCVVLDLLFAVGLVWFECLVINLLRTLLILSCGLV